jgi:AcrR family transcriptional regulator
LSDEGGQSAAAGESANEVEPQPPRRGRPRRASARDTIIEATLALLVERGFHATTIAAIAVRAGVGRNTIYRRWSSKEELIADALHELTADLDVLEAGDLQSPPARADPRPRADLCRPALRPHPPRRPR